MNEYDDLLFLPRPASHRKKMPLSDRAAQFAPFKALVGLENTLQETARTTEEESELCEDELENIDRAFARLKSLLPTLPKVRITYFQKDLRKDGGAYVTKEGNVRRIDEAHRKLIFSDETSVSMDGISEIILL